MKDPCTNALLMDVIAKDGTPLRLTVHPAEDGYVGLDSMVEVTEHRHGSLRPLVSYHLRNMLVEGDLTLHDQVPGLTIERPWLVTFGDWALLAAETQTDVRARNGGTLTGSRGA